MKKLIIPAIALIAVLGLAACQQKTDTSKPGAPDEQPAATTPAAKPDDTSAPAKPMTPAPAKPSTTPEKK